MIKSLSMRRRPVAVAFLLIGSLVLTASPASANFHLWQIKEVFSNADGSVQFVELFDNTANENYVDGFSLRAESTTGGNTTSQDFVFPDNIPLEADTMNRHILIATSNFASLPGGVTPDFTFDQSSSPIVGPFFDPNANLINFTFFASSDTIEFAGAQLPKNGINSLTDTALYLEPNLISSVNSPTNLSNQTGSINLSPGPTGDYNGNHVVDAADYVNWRDRMNQTGLTPGSGPDGSGNGTVDLADYTFWRSKFGNPAGSGSGVPEPASLFALEFITLIIAAGRHRR